MQIIEKREEFLRVLRNISNNFKLFKKSQKHCTNYVYIEIILEMRGKRRVTIKMNKTGKLFEGNFQEYVFFEGKKLRIKNFTKTNFSKTYFPKYNFSGEIFRKSIFSKQFFYHVFFFKTILSKVFSDNSFQSFFRLFFLPN